MTRVPTAPAYWNQSYTGIRANLMYEGSRKAAIHSHPAAFSRLSAVQEAASPPYGVGG
jgi:hypothetical protein